MGSSSSEHVYWALIRNNVDSELVLMAASTSTSVSGEQSTTRPEPNMLGIIEQVIHYRPPCIFRRHNFRTIVPGCSLGLCRGATRYAAHAS